MRKLVNKLKIFSNYIFRRELFNIYPSLLAVEITNYCNLSCTVCSRKKMTRPLRHMSFEEFRTYIEQAKEYTELVFLHGHGEPLLNKELPRMIDHAAEAGINTCISTNMTLLDAEWVERLLQSRLDFLICAIDGIDRQSYEKIRRGANFDKMMANFRGLLARKSALKRGPHITAQIINTPGMQYDKKEFAKLFSADEFAQIDQIRLKTFYSSFGDDPGSSETPWQRCYYPYNFLFLYVDGRVGLCCVDYDAKVVLGDLRSQTLSDIWSGGIAVSIREKMSARSPDIPEICKGCSIPAHSGFNAFFLLGGSLIPASWLRRGLGGLEKLLRLVKRV